MRAHKSQVVAGLVQGQKPGKEKPLTLQVLHPAAHKEASGRRDSCQFPKEQMAQQRCLELPYTQAPRTDLAPHSWDQE